MVDLDFVEFGRKVAKLADWDFDFEDELDESLVEALKWKHVLDNAQVIVFFIHLFVFVW